MNANYLTSTKDFDYRFLSRLVTSVYEKDELINGCIKVESARSKNSRYEELDSLKFDFVRGSF